MRRAEAWELARAEGWSGAQAWERERPRAQAWERERAGPARGGAARSGGSGCRGSVVWLRDLSGMAAE